MYYSERGEVAGVWMGSGAEALGLQGQVRDQSLLALLAGYAPDARRLPNGVWEGRELVPAPAGGQHMPGIDATFKAPKSVSLLWAFGCDVQLGETTLDEVVREAHDEAVREALRHYEEQAAFARRGHAGKEHVRTSGFIAAGFRHRTSRAMDPHLHTHVLLSNVAEREDGAWGALDGRLLYAWAKTAGYLYESHLRAELTRRLGVQWTEVRHGIADIEGIERLVIDAFSKRRDEILNALPEVAERLNHQRLLLGLPPIDPDSQDALDIASHQTRARKLLDTSTEELRRGWSEEAAALGLNLATIQSTLERLAPERRGAIPVSELEADIIAAKLTQHASTFGRRDAIQGVAASRRDGMTVSEVLGHTETLLESPRAVELSGDQALRRQDLIRLRDGSLAPIPTDRRRYTTPDMLAVERGIVDSAERRRDAEAVVVAAEAVDGALESALKRIPTLGHDQVAAVLQASLSGAGVEIMRAGPGSGKTTVAGIVADACGRAGVPVVAVALSARARDQLREGAGLADVRTIASLLGRLDIGAELQVGSLLLVDEAGMVDSRTFAQLLNHAEQAGVKVLCLGDERQLPEIDAGGAFRGLAARLGAIELNQNRRQLAGWEREAVFAYEQGRVSAAVRAYEEHGRIAYGDPAEMMQEMVVAYLQARERGRHVVMQSHDWADVSRINLLTREARVRRGEVESEGIRYHGQVIGVGDEIRCHVGEEQRLGVINGTEGTVVAVDADHRQLTIVEEVAGSRIVLGRDYLDHTVEDGGPAVRLAYCKTEHSVQGGTWRDDTYTFARPESSTREGLFVDLTRGRSGNYVFFAGPRLVEDDYHLPAEDWTPPRQRLLAAMTRSHAKVMAIDLLEEAEDAGTSTATAPMITQWGTVRMTERQAVWLADLGALPENRDDLTWLEASILIDRALGSPDGEAGRRWLHEQGASPEQIEAALERTQEGLGSPDLSRSPHRGRSSAIRAVRANLEESAPDSQTPGQRRLLDAVWRWEERLGEEIHEQNTDEEQQIRSQRVLDLEARAAADGLTRVQREELERLHKRGPALRLPRAETVRAVSRAEQRRAYYRETAHFREDQMPTPDQPRDVGLGPEVE